MVIVGRLARRGTADFPRGALLRSAPRLLYSIGDVYGTLVQYAALTGCAQTQPFGIDIGIESDFDPAWL